MLKQRTLQTITRAVGVEPDTLLELHCHCTCLQHATNTPRRRRLQLQLK